MEGGNDYWGTSWHPRGERMVKKAGSMISNDADVKRDVGCKC